jgi:hypothetical protein
MGPEFVVEQTGKVKVSFFGSIFCIVLKTFSPVLLIVRLSLAD